MNEIASNPSESLGIDDITIKQEVNVDSVPLFHVSLKKLVIMFVMTYGMYQLVWFFKQWQCLKKHYELDAWPVARSIFAIFFTHSLFVYVNEYIKETKREYIWGYSALATIFVLLQLASAISNNIINIETSHMALVVLSLVLPLFALIPIYRAQQAINFALEAVEHPVNDRLTGLNWVWIVIGALYWLMVTAGIGLIALEV